MQPQDADGRDGFGDAGDAEPVTRGEGFPLFEIGESVGAGEDETAVVGDGKGQAGRLVARHETADGIVDGGLRGGWERFGRLPRGRFGGGGFLVRVGGCWGRDPLEALVMEPVRLIAEAGRIEPGQFDADGRGSGLHVEGEAEEAAPWQETLHTEVAGTA